MDRLTVHGRSESEVQALLAGIAAGKDEAIASAVEYARSSSGKAVDLMLRNESAGVLDELKLVLGPERCTVGGESLASAVLRDSRSRGVMIATAESCTGGLLGAVLTAVPGSSDVVWGSFVTYSYEAKVTVLGVDRATLERFGAVSREVVLEMARGARDRSGCALSLAISGVAGPGGGTREKPVGTVWIACDAAWQEPHAVVFNLAGDRDAVRESSVLEALVLIRAALLSG